MWQLCAQRAHWSAHKRIRGGNVAVVRRWKYGSCEGGKMGGGEMWQVEIRQPNRQKTITQDSEFFHF